MVKRIPVGAHYGLRDWLVQRVTAVVMAVYAVLTLVMLLAKGPSDHASWKAMFVPQWWRLATLLFLLSVFWHAWIGVRDILMDYVLLDFDPEVEDLATSSWTKTMPAPIEANLRILAVQILYEVCRVQKFSLADLRMCRSRTTYRSF